MTEHPNNTPADKKLEGMLRRWGAAEAVAEATPPPAPVALRPKRSVWWSVAHWMSLAAAAGILVVAGLQLVLPQARNERGRARDARKPAAPAAHEDRMAHAAPATEGLAELKARYDAAVKAVADAETQRDQAQRKAEGMQEDRDRLAARVAMLEGVCQTNEKTLAGLQTRLTEADKAKTRAQTEAREAEARLGRARDQVATLQGEKKKLEGTRKELHGEVASLTGKLAAAQGEQQKLTQMVASAQVELDKLRKAARRPAVAAAPSVGGAKELARLAAARRAMLTDLQRGYLRLASGSGAGLAARQEAAKRARLVARVKDARPLAQAPTTRELIDRLEVTLTRLALLDADKADSEQALARMVAGGHLIEAIDQALASGKEAPATRTWLLEVRLVLGGTTDVG